MKKLFMAGAVFSVLAGCGTKPATVVESVDLFTAVGDLGAKEDLLLIYSDEDLVRWGVAPMLAHFSWVPLLDDYAEGSPLSWMISQF